MDIPSDKTQTKVVQSSSRFEDQHDIISGNKRYTGDVGSAVHGETGKNERNYYSDGNNMVASETDGYYDGIERLEGYAAEECEEVTGDYKSKKEHFRWSRSILEEETYPENVLSVDEAKKCLNRIGQVGNGLSYAYIQIDVDHRNFTDIEEITNFKHLSIVNASHNYLDLNALDVLRGLEYVVYIQADHNVVNSLCLSPMPYLQVLTLNSNRISSLSGLKQPSLERLELNDNEINVLTRKLNKNSVDQYNCNDIDCPNLTVLALSRNALETIEQIMFVSVKLRILYLSYNKIKNLNGIANLRNLSHLNLRGNNISNLDGFTNNLSLLSYLNLRENRLYGTDEIIKLTCLKSLETLVVLNNDFDDCPVTLRPKILTLLPWLKRINKDLVSISEVRAVSNKNYLGEGGGEELQYEEE